MPPAAIPFTAVRDGAIGRRLTLFMVLAFVALIGAGFAALWVNAENRRHTRSVAHSYEVETVILDARRLLEQGEVIRRGMSSYPDEPAFQTSYGAVMREVYPKFRQLRRLIADNPAQKRAYARLARQVTDRSIVAR
ncbi:CHASE3 domain-containing protein [Sphingomonas sp. MMS24-JH45]